MSELMFDEIHEEKRIKVRSAEIVVHGTLEKPYYEIKYQTTDEEWHIGYSSRKLEHVFWWLKNCFEIFNYEQGIRNKTIEEFSRKVKALLPVAYWSDNPKIGYKADAMEKALFELRGKIDEIAEQMKESSR